VTVTVIPPGEAFRHHSDQRVFCDVTTHGHEWRPLSPMVLGPVPLYGGMWSKTMENAWQYAKFYPAFTGTQAAENSYWPWARAGWDSPRAVRHPMGDAVPLFSLWAGDRLGYVSARKRVYAPLYAQAVRMHQLMLYLRLRDLAGQAGVVLVDFDGYDHRALGYSWDDVLSDPDRKMGHGFVLAMMIEGYL
jgi:uncharacterized protein DUF6939